jgi:hypothetical protein
MAKGLRDQIAVAGVATVSAGGSWCLSLRRDTNCPRILRVLYYGLVLIGEGQPLVLEAMGLPQQPVEIHAERMGHELVVEARA